MPATITKTAKVLLKAADFYARNPAALKEGRHLASVIADQATYLSEDRAEAIDAVRNAIGAPGVSGALTVWSRKHTARDAIALLKKAAGEVELEAAEEAAAQVTVS